MPLAVVTNITNVHTYGICRRHWFISAMVSAIIAAIGCGNDLAVNSPC